MKRAITLMLVLLLGSVLAMWAIGSDKRESEYYRHMGPGMMGPGMMGPGMMGPGMMGPGMMGMDLSGLPEEDVQKLNALHDNSMRAMEAMMPEHRRKMSELHDALGEMPLNVEKAKAAWAAMGAEREVMFDAHLEMMRQAQEVLGEARWREWHERSGKAMMGRGPMHRGMRGGPADR